MSPAVRQLQRRPQPPAESLAALSALPPVMARVLAARGVCSPDELVVDFSRLLPPTLLKGLDAAVAVLVDAIVGRRSILVVGDYDADGATSTALCVSLLRDFGAVVDFLVPDRVKHGYGLQPVIVDLAAARFPENSPGVILTVDNGMSSHEGVLAARERGIAVVITDHHLPAAELPAADAIVNPNQPGCAFPSKAIAGVGVAFYVMSAVRAALRARGWFGQQRAEPNLADALDLVALGTVADVVPLDANNRVFVEQGLRRMRAGRMRPGIAALIAIAKRNAARLVAADLGFSVGPRLNAAGRLDDMSHGIRCLLAKDDAEAQRLAAELDALNRDRRFIENDMQQEALQVLSRLALDEGSLPNGVCLFDAGWHAGVVGIVASRIKERCHRPVIAFAPASPGSDELRGSGRSIEGLHIRDAIDAVAAHHPGLIARFGGHAMAAGLTISRADFDMFSRAFDAEVTRMLMPGALSPVLLTDGELPLAQLDLALAAQLREAVPWGQAFPAPLFDGEFEVLQQRVVGEKHLKLVLSSPQAGGRVIDAVFFNADMQRWPNAARRVRAACRVDVNEYRGVRTPQLIVEWLEPL